MYGKRECSLLGRRIYTRLADFLWREAWPCYLNEVLPGGEAAHQVVFSGLGVGDGHV